MKSCDKQTGWWKPGGVLDWITQHSGYKSSSGSSSSGSTTSGASSYGSATSGRSSYGSSGFSGSSFGTARTSGSYSSSGKLKNIPSFILKLTLRRPLRRKLWMRWFFDISKVKESSFFGPPCPPPPSDY